MYQTFSLLFSGATYANPIDVYEISFRTGLHFLNGNGGFERLVKVIELSHCLKTKLTVPEFAAVEIQSIHFSPNRRCIVYSMRW